MGKRVVLVASNFGLWAEELQGPWDALKQAGHDLTLATYRGLPPGVLKLSMDPDFVDPMQGVKVNPAPMVARVEQILADGEWDHTIKIADIKMADYDAIVLVGGPGSPLDIAGNGRIHRLLEEAYKTDKIIGAICYAVGALVWARDMDNDGRSIIYGKTVTAHPREWDFIDDLPYWLHNPTAENPELNLFTPGFVFPLAQIVENAVGPAGTVLSDPTTTHEKQLVAFDYPFVTALSAESSSDFGAKLVEVLETEPSAGRKMLRRHMHYLYNNDVAGMLANEYTEDAVVVVDNNVVQGREALTGLMTGFIQMIGEFRYQTIDRFVETENSVLVESTVKMANLGVSRVYDLYILRDGKIAQQIKGVK